MSSNSYALCDLLRSCFRVKNRPVIPKRKTPAQNSGLPLSPVCTVLPVEAGVFADDPEDFALDFFSSVTAFFSAGSVKRIVSVFAPSC